MNLRSRSFGLLWIAIAAITLGFYGPSLIVAHQLLQTACSGTHCFDHQISPAAAAALRRHGLSLAFYGNYYTALAAGFAAVWTALALLLTLRKPNDPLALFTAMTFVTFGCSLLGVMNAPAAIGDTWAPWAQLFNNEGFLFLFILLYVFPSSRFIPSWTRWIAVLLVALEIPSTFAPHSLFNADNWPGPLPVVPFAVLTFSSIYAQIYRYRRVSGPVERQQTKWVVFGAIAALLLFFAINAVQTAIPSFDQTGSVAWLIVLTLVIAAFFLIPLSFAIAILRHGLWDIDVLINRTLVYGLLTVTLAVGYLGGVIAAQFILRILTGQSSELAIAVVTLAVAALFNPWRRSLQAFIDRRFYRRKYDSARTLSAFQRTLRDEVELEHLRADLLHIIHETMQPSVVSLWLNEEGSRD